MIAKMEPNYKNNLRSSCMSVGGCKLSHLIWRSLKRKFGFKKDFKMGIWNIDFTNNGLFAFN
jgi:hypothetical protein